MTKLKMLASNVEFKKNTHNLHERIISKRCICCNHKVFRIIGMGVSFNFHAGDTSSNLVGDAIFIPRESVIYNRFPFLVSVLKFLWRHSWRLFVFSPEVFVNHSWKLKLYGGHVESDFVWQNHRCWQDILTLDLR